MANEQEQGPVSASPFFEVLATGTRWVTNVCLVSLVVLVCTEAFLRSTLNYSLGFAEEVTSYLVVVLTLTGAALAVRYQALFQVEFLYQRFATTTRLLLTWLFGLLALIVCLVLAWKTMDLTLSSLSRGKFAPTVLRTPLWIPQLMMPIGFVVIMLFVIERITLAHKILSHRATT